MRVVVYPHELAIGGSQINAIDLAACLRDRGHHVWVYSQHGPLADYVVSEKGLTFVPARRLRYRPAPSRIAQLARLARRERIDVIHGYEWPPCLDAYFGARLLLRVPLVCTVLSMGFTPLVPTTVPLLMGTQELAEQVATQWAGQVGVMEPPIDVLKDHPSTDGSAYRAQLGVGPDEVLVVSVSRLSVDLKLDALKDAIDATALVARELPIRLVLVGEGDASAELSTRAAAVNAAAGRIVVEVPGPLFDPRPAYAAADVVVGMGSSALRAMAHGKPVIVQGENGFARVFDRESAPFFLHAGFYGVGTGGSAAPAVADGLRRLAADRAERADLGRYGREVVEQRFSLEAAADRLEALYEQARDSLPSRRADLAQAAVMAWRALLAELRLHDPRLKKTRRADRHARLAAAASHPGPDQGRPTRNDL